MAFTPIDQANDRYDVIVIGSGLGGMTCANRLARAGHSVLLLEHHNQLGGLATWFKRKGHIFDVSLHGFPYGMVKTCKKYWNKAIRDSIVQLKNIVFDNPQFSLTTSFSREDFTRILQEKFGVDPAVVEDFFATVGQMNFYDDKTMTTRELFEKFFPGRSDVHRLLMEPITYANGSTLDEPAITYGIVFSNFMNKGVFTFQGGTDKLIGMMADELQKNVRLKQIILQAFREGRSDEGGLACFPRPPQEGGLPHRQPNIQQPGQHLNHGSTSCLVELLWSMIHYGFFVNIYVYKLAINWGRTKVEYRQLRRELKKGIGLES